MSSDDFRCGLCNKTYSRRDLRDRHRRRCVKTFGQERASKRKSCVSCAQKKLRCSLTRPMCIRCVQSKIPCCYPNSSEAAEDRLEERNAIEVTPPTALPSDGNNVYEMAWDPELHNVDLGFNFPAQDQWPGSESGFVGELFLPLQDNSKGPQPLDISPTLLSGDTLQPPLSSSSSSSSSKYQGQQKDADSSLSNVFASHFDPDLSCLEQQDTTDLFNKLFDIMRDYPQMMLQRGFYSPFIHHSLYRCSREGMAEPLGIALACVAAYLNSVDSSYEYVQQLINSQQERLVNDFYRYTEPETSLAAIHAVCVYQILGFFGILPVDGPNKSPKGDSEKKRRNQGGLGKTAELHLPFLIKMARRLCHLHKESLERQEADWSEWKYAESLRRNIFLVHVVNILAAKARKLHYDYFEPLNDATVLQLPLPAPEHMWRACNEDEWLAAREVARQTPLASCTLQDLIDLDHAGGLNVASLVPLTRIIFACHKLQPESSLMRG